MHPLLINKSAGIIVVRTVYFINSIGNNGEVTRASIANKTVVNSLPLSDESFISR